jgi:hypothetical protein
MEILYFIGAFILLAALIYGTLNYHYRTGPRAGLQTRSFGTDTSITRRRWPYGHHSARNASDF